MDIITHWQGTPTFPEADKSDWEKLKGAIQGNSFAGKCHVGDEDYGDQIVLRIVDLEGESLGITRYTNGELARVSHRDLSLDLKVVTDLRNGKHTKLLNLVFNYYLKNQEWPNSEEISIKAADFGFFWDMAQEIGREYIRVAHAQRSDSVTRLTIKGVSVCDDNIYYLSPFKHTIKELVDRYRKNYEHPTITTKELIDKGLFGIGGDSLIYHMIVEEDGLVTEAIAPRENKEGKFTISPDILRYVHVNSIREYLRIQRYETADPDYSTSFPTTRSDSIVESSTRIEEEFQYDLFISYSTRDSNAAKKIDTTADSLGLKCFLAEKDLKGGDEWADRIRDALNSSREVVILVTPNSIESIWVQRELTAAWVLYKRLTPILLNCTEKDLPDLLKPRHYVKFRNIEKFLREVYERKHEP